MIGEGVISTRPSRTRSVNFESEAVAMQAQLVTVIIPTYNRLNCLVELIESLYQQTHRQLQIVIVNDAGPSVDHVRTLYPELDITVLNMPHNRGQVQALNYGLEFARSEYIMLCDDDDLLVPSHTERALRTIGDYDLVYADAEIFQYAVDQDGVRRATNRFVFAYELDLDAMRQFSTFVPSGCLYCRSLHERIGLFDPEVAHYFDWDFFLRVAAIGSIKRMPVASVLYAFAPAGDNISANLNTMRPYLDKLSSKHGLGDLPTANFFLLLEEPEIQKRRATTEVLWDGQPFIPRRLGTAPPRNHV